MRAPGIEIPFLHLWHPTVVENKNYIGALGDEVNRDRKLPSQNADVERQTVIRKRSHILDEGCSLAHFVRLSVKHTANTLQFRMPCDLLQIEAKSLALGSAASHNAFERIVRLIAEREQ